MVKRIARQRIRRTIDALANAPRPPESRLLDTTDLDLPPDIEVRRNHFFKPLSWKRDHPSYAGIEWTVKNLLEFKNAQRVLIDGNVFENDWVAAQNGVAVLFTPRNQDGGAPWSVVQDVTFTHNIVRHSTSAVLIHGIDTIHTITQRTRRILIASNFLVCPRCLARLDPSAAQGRCPNCGFAFESADSLETLWREIYRVPR